jgi:hypothetical protein
VELPALRNGLLLVGRPSWMVLDDDTPPVLRSAELDGRSLPLPKNGGVDLGCLAPGVHRLALLVEDADNPLAVESVRVAPGARAASGLSARMETTGGKVRRAFVRIAIACKESGVFTPVLMVADRSPDCLIRRIPLRYAVMGIAVSADRQEIRLSNGRREYLFRPDRSRQLRLPDGAWAKLTTNMRGQWLYPRTFTQVETVTADDGLARTVRVTASVQSIKGEPVERLGRLEFELTVRTDTPVLLVSSRSINISHESVPVYANWGWLPGRRYVTSAGVREWRGRATNRYLDVGHVGWLWLAPRTRANDGIAWMSPLKFGESRFDTMLLYSDRKMCKPGEGVVMDFAIAPTEEAADARALYEDLTRRKLLGPPR